MRLMTGALVVAAAIASVAIGCAFQATSSGLATEPEASLAPVGATRLGGGGHEAAVTIDGPVPAERFTIYGSFDGSDAVERFYRTALEQDGWVPGGGSSRVPATHEQRVVAWQKAGLIFRLGFWKVDAWRSRSTVGLEFPTIFDASLITDPTASRR